MLNKYLAIGNLTQDPTSRAFESGNTVCNFSIAINSPQGSPLYMDVQAWNKNAEKCQKHLQKGDRVFIEGKLKSNQWTTQQGEKRQKTYCSADLIHFLSGNSKGAVNNITTAPEDDSPDLPDGLSQQDFDQIPF